MGVTIKSAARTSHTTKPTLTVEQWRKEIGKAFSVAGPWAPSTKDLPTVKRSQLPEKLHKFYDDAKSAGDGTVTVYRKDLDSRSAFLFEWPDYDQGVHIQIMDATGHAIAPYRDRKKEAEMDTNNVLNAVKEDHFKGQRPASKDKTVDHWLRMYQAVGDEAGTSEFLDAPDTWKVTPKKLEKVLGGSVPKVVENFHAEAAYRDPTNGSILLEKTERKDAGVTVRHYMVLNNLGKALQKVNIKSEI